MSDHIRWRKSSRSGANANGCVELSDRKDQVRDSKNPDGPRLRVNVTSLLTWVKLPDVGDTMSP